MNQQPARLIEVADNTLGVAIELEKRVSAKPSDAVVMVLHAFLKKAISTGKAILLLYRESLPTEGQILVRVLAEIRIDLRMLLKLWNEHGVVIAIERIADAMTLEKAKQQRASNYRGHNLVEHGISPEQWDRIEKQLHEKYGKEFAKKMARYGFSGKSIEDRSKEVELEDLYNVLYRNFSRNVHGTDYAEKMQEAGWISGTAVPEYEELRDKVALSATIRCLSAVTHQVDRVLRTGLEDQIDTVAKAATGLGEWVNVP